MPSLRATLAALALALAIPLAHRAMLHGTEFVLDDTPIVAQNTRLHIESADDLVTLATTKYWGRSYASERLWRPLSLLTFAADLHLVGHHPDRLRAINLAWHTLATLAVFALFTHILPLPHAFAAAALFGLLPVHTEATATLVGRAEILALLLSSLGVLAHLRGLRTHPAWFAAAAAAFFLAFTSKEISLTAPFLLPLLVLAARRRDRLPPYACYLTALLAYFAARAAVLHDLAPSSSAQVIGNLSLFERLLVATETAGHNILTLLTWQAPSAHHPFTPPAWNDPHILALASAHLAALALATYALTRRSARPLGVAVWGLYLSMGPVLNIIPIGVIRADRLLYTPSLFSCLLLGAALSHIPRRARTLALAALLIPYALHLPPHLRAWTTDTRLWNASFTRYPRDPLINAHLGRQLRNDLEHRRAIPHLEFAIAHIPADALPGANARAELAGIYDLAGNPAHALRLIEEASQHFPHHPRIASSAAKILIRNERYAEATALCQDAVDHGADSYALRLAFGASLASQGLLTQAIAQFDLAHSWRQLPWEATFNRGLANLQLGRTQLALADFHHVLAWLSAQDPLPPRETSTATRAATHILELDPSSPAARAWLDAHP